MEKESALNRNVSIELHKAAGSAVALFIAARCADCLIPGVGALAEAIYYGTATAVGSGIARTIAEEGYSQKTATA